jgi:acetyl-CoA hydrolase
MASPVASAALKARVRNPALLKKLARPEDLMHHFPNGSYIGWSGFTAVGYPKYVSAPSLINPLPYNCVEC